MACHVSICIVGFRNAQEIATCVAALDASDYADFDIVICENGGNEAAGLLRQVLPERLAGGQPIECLSAPDNPGYAGGINRAMRARPDSSAWWVLNPDTMPETGALAALVKRLERGDVHAVGGVLYRADGTAQALGGQWRSWLGRAVSLGMGCRLDALPPSSGIEEKLDYVLGASLLAGRTFVERAGYMREDYFLYGEEVEWCLRAKQRGLRLGFAPAALVLHGQGGTTGSAEPIHRRPRLPIYLDERNKLHIVRDTVRLRWPVAVLAMPFLSFLRYGARGAFRQWGHALSGWWAALRGERGKPGWIA